MTTCVLQYLPLLIGIVVAGILLKVFHTQSLPTVTFTIITNGITYVLKGKSHMTNATIDNTVSISAAFADKSGNSTTPDTAPTWTVDNAALATLAPAADGMSVVVTPVGPVGTATVTLTDGTITASTVLVFTGGKASTVVLTDVVNVSA